MTYYPLTDLSHEQEVTEEHMDEIRETAEHANSMKFADVAISALAGGTSAARIATGTYTGNGAATQAITGVGFQPKRVEIYPQVDATNPETPIIKTNQDGTKSRYHSAYKDDHVVSLDSNGFTVGDGTGDTNYCNVSSRVYTYVAFG